MGLDNGAPLRLQNDDTTVVFYFTSKQLNCFSYGIDLENDLVTFCHVKLKGDEIRREFRFLFYTKVVVHHSIYLLYDSDNTVN